MKMILEKFSKLLVDMDKNKTSEFEGIGLIIYSSLSTLPISPINPNYSSLNLPQNKYDEILATLLDVSSTSNPFHDGFHLISKDFALTHVSQYFSTPIIQNLIIENQYGSRYRTALYGSFLTEVLFTGVLSKNYGPIIFEKGKNINPFHHI